MTADQASMVRMMASTGMGWEDIFVRLSKNGTNLRKEEVRRVVLDRGRQ